MPPSPSQVATQTEMTEPFRLMDLPPELRIHIYEYAFTPRPPKNPNKNSEHFDSQAPSKSLLLTNQLIYKEARPIYQEACQRFWAYSVSFIVKEIELQPNTRPRDREEVLGRFNGRPYKPQLEFTLLEDHLHMQLVYKFTVKPFWNDIPMYLGVPDPAFLAFLATVTPDF